MSMIIVGGANESAKCPDMEITNQALKASILQELPSRLLGQTAVLVGRMVGQTLASVGARRYHFAVLATLREFGPTSQAELCRRTDIDRSDMNATLNELESAGSILRSIDPANRRQNIVALTKRGRARFEDLRCRLEVAQNKAFGLLSADEKSLLMGLLRRVHDHLAAESEGDGEERRPQR